MTRYQLPADISTGLVGALELAAAGVPVFPCRPDKTPLTPHGFKDASIDAAAVMALWAQRPDALIGTPTGIKFDVLDLDLQHEAARRWYDEHRHRIPVTRAHRTRSGGLHLLFEPHATVKCSGGKIALGVDTRGMGGYVIWWPAHGFAVENPGTFAPLPQWLIAVLNPPKPTLASSTPVCPLVSRSDAWLRGLVRLVAWAPEGRRNAILFWASCRGGEAVRDGKAPEGFVVDVLIEAATYVGLTEPEARRTIQSGLRTTGARS
jgi:hypothetical protein